MSLNNANVMQDPGTHRQRLLTKIAEAVVRTRGLPDLIAAYATFEAVRTAKDVATHDKEHRIEAIGYCKGP